MTAGDVTARWARVAESQLRIAVARPDAMAFHAASAGEVAGADERKPVALCASRLKEAALL